MLPLHCTQCLKEPDGASHLPGRSEMSRTHTSGVVTSGGWSQSLTVTIHDERVVARNPSQCSVSTSGGLSRVIHTNCISI